MCYLLLSLSGGHLLYLACEVMPFIMGIIMPIIIIIMIIGIMADIMPVQSVPVDVCSG